MVNTQKHIEKGWLHRNSNGGEVWRKVVGAGLRGLLAFAAMAIGAARLPAQTVAADRVVFSNSIKPVSEESTTATTASEGSAESRTQATVTRWTLTDEEISAPMNFAVALKMRNLAELQERVGRGEKISPSEMMARYFPLAGDYEQVQDWLTSQGLTITRSSDEHVAVYARGTVSQVGKVFEVQFARVTGKDGVEYTSAVTAPSVPAELAGALVSINGLQPHVRMHKHLVRPQSGNALSAPDGYLTAPVMLAYNATGLGLTGAGQTIGIVIDVPPNKSDLTAFWKKCGVTRTGSYTVVQTVTGHLFPPEGEETLDTEWSSSMAPGANLRVFVSTDLYPLDIDQSYQEILDEVMNGTVQGLNQVSMSFGDVEDDDVIGQMENDDQDFFLPLSALGVTMFASSGDGGSRPNFNAFGTVYDKHGTVQVENPASDPYVTGVGGTNLQLSTSTTGSNVIGETAWSVQGNGDTGATGGGASQLFPRASWQVGAGVPSGNPAAAGLGSSPPARLVPDVAGIAAVATPVMFFFEGEEQPIAGTSVASPMWVGFCALINQARANGGETSLGLLGPRIYPLLGSPAFRDITSGSNGDYSAGVGYDMCTGVGAPNVGNLVQALTNEPTIVTPPASVTVSAGQNAAFSVTANSTTSLSYQWQREANGTATWSNLTNDGTYSGANTATLTVTVVTVPMSGDQFRCVVRNSFNALATSDAAVLTVTVPLAVTTLAGLTGNAGSTDSGNGSAQFDGPNGVAVDLGGNIFVADSLNNTIREITPAGVVTTIAGLAGVSGNTDAAGSLARFSNPTALTVDSGGNIYVTDTSNDDIRKITPAGVVSTLAGQPGVAGVLDGLGSAAQFNGPQGIAVDNQGDLFVSDTKNHTIRLVTAAGNVTTIAGKAGFNGSVDDVGVFARFGAPTGITLDNRNNYYVVDAAFSTVRQITFNHFDYTVSTLAGSAGTTGSADGTGTSALFNQPEGITTNGNGTLFVTDTLNDTLRQVTTAGVVTTLAGSAGNPGGVDGLGTAAQFNTPTGVAMNGLGTLYIADSKNDTIRETGPNPAPQWQTQPQSKQVVTGQSASFTVQASGTPAPAYQWQISTDAGVTWGNLSEGGNFAGTTNGTLKIVATNVGMTGNQFRCVATNSAGSTTSNTATLTVITPLTFVTQPVGLNVKAATKVTLSVSATAASALTYQWQFNGANITGATNATLVFKSVATANSGNYTVVVTSALGSLTSDSAMLMVAKVVPKITVQPSPFSTMAGSTATFSVTATGDPVLSYMWKKGTVLVVNGTNVSGATSARLVLSNVSSSTAGSYLVVVSNPAGKATSKSVKLVVTTP